MQIVLNNQNGHLVIEKAVTALEKGGIVIYPSDTTYGIAVDSTNPVALDKLEKIKGRRSDQKFSYNFSDLDMVEKFAEPSDDQVKILKQYLPGPYTFILSADISIRIPKSTIITDITKSFGKPTTATSANQTGYPPATSIKNLDAKIYLAADLIIEDLTFEAKSPSTIIDLSGPSAKVVREGEFPFPRKK